ncbi:MAG: hypothetical protein ACQXXH_02865 [Candidatus Bathyarchaeia archaeon]|jgi:hypothetical protein|nr:hypothetical protein [Candidatus Bathyarchaeota archaeon A05DMB-4]MDH7594685.1 hypothetical protein [Candidatus Bathyarchaeota archaeon]
MQILALLLIVVSALSFGLTLYLILTTEWNVGWEFFDMGWEHANWWEGTWSFSIWGGEHYNWFFGYYYESFVVNDFNPFKSFYMPFPSVLGGIYFLVCGIVFWFVKTENPAQWLGCRNMRDKQCVLRVSLLIVGGALSLLFSEFSMYYQAWDDRLNTVYPYQQYGFPLALLGIALLALGILGFYFVIMENPRLPQFFEPQPPQQS